MTSVKYLKNLSISNNFDELTNKQIFTSSKNVFYIYYFIKNVAYINSILKNTNQLAFEMKQWADINNINDYEYLTDDIIEKLGFINKMFIDEYLHKNYIECDDVTKLEGIVTDASGNASNKKYKGMLASDFQTLNLWNNKSGDTYRYNANFRDNNKIPMWQKSMQIRHYDRNNEGLSTHNSENYTLDNQIRGYDMSNIINSLHVL